MKLEMITVKDRNNGYGVSKDLIIHYLKKKGIQLLDKFETDKPKDCSLVYSYPTNLKWVHGPKKVCFTMFETDKIPDNWIPFLNKYDLVLVPTEWGKEIFERCGVKTPIKVLNLGYNADVYKYYDRPERDIFTFLNYEAFTIRKGWHELFEAFKREFKPSEPVRIIFKTVAKEHGQNIVSLNQYPNMESINEGYSNEQMFELLKEADCFVFPSRGEGFGIPPLEAMATGLPVIAPNAHSIQEYFSYRYMIPVNYKSVKARYDNIEGDLGNFIKCDIKDLQRAMRFVYEERKDWRKKSFNTSQYVLKYKIENTVNNLIRVLEKLCQ